MLLELQKPHLLLLIQKRRMFRHQDQILGLFHYLFCLKRRKVIQVYHQILLLVVFTVFQFCVLLLSFRLGFAMMILFSVEFESLLAEMTFLI